MRLWALSDPHLTLSTPSKAMHVFGEQWRDHEEKIATAWRASVAAEDVVVLPGDISWASHWDDALTDLEFLHRLPGTKVLLEGNHDRWCDSPSRIRRYLPPSLRLVSGDHLEIGPWLFFGTRLWEHEEADVDSLIRWTRLSDKTPERRTQEDRERNERIWSREVARLQRCVEGLPRRASRRICLTHYPPLGASLAPTRASAIVEASGAELCVFGHLHSLKDIHRPPQGDLLGTTRGVRYVLASCDYRNFQPLFLQEA
ncbi:MAG: metallophosphoesterase [Fibrobacteria bacterium]|nr:metallophosphoesterase [Fibrobacteria bacterium]